MLANPWNISDEAETAYGAGLVIVLTLGSVYHHPRDPPFERAFTVRGTT